MDTLIGLTFNLRFIGPHGRNHFSSWSAGGGQQRFDEIPGLASVQDNSMPRLQSFQCDPTSSGDNETAHRLTGQSSGLGKDRFVLGGDSGNQPLSLSRFSSHWLRYHS